MSSLQSPDNSFIKFSETGPSDNGCGFTVPFCLPVNSWEDMYVQFQTSGLVDCPTVDIHLKVNGELVKALDALNCATLYSTDAPGPSYITVDINTNHPFLLIAKLTRLYGGTWTQNPDDPTELDWTGDLDTMDGDTIAGVTMHKHCDCYLNITSDAPNYADIVNYLNTNSPGSGIWYWDGNTPGKIYSHSDICSFAGSAGPGITYTVLTSTHCHLKIDSYASTNSDVVDWLNQNKGSYGVWSIGPDGIVCTGSIIGFAETIPGVTYTVHETIITTYTNLHYGRLGTDDEPIETYADTDGCFTITADLDGTTYTSNCFSYQPITCFNTRIKYRSDQNVFGFIYVLDDPDNPGTNLLADFYNTVRIQTYTRHPELKSTETVFRDSAGNYTLLSSVMERVWECPTDWTDANWHKAFFVALANNDYQMYDNDADTWTAFRKDGEFKIAWDKTPALNINSAPATVQLKESPFHQYNSNCN